MLTEYNCFGFIDDIYKYKDVETRTVLKSSVSTPFITILIPTYKRPDTLKETIDSVLNQIDFIDYEIIIMDNDNSDNSETENMIRHYNHSKISYYKNTLNLGQIGNWNKGFLLAKSEWVVLLHDDDYILPQYLSKIVSVLKENPEIQGLFTVPMNEYIKEDNSAVGIKSRQLREEKNSNTYANKSSFKSTIKKSIFSIRQKYKQKYKGSLTKLDIKDYYFDCGIFAPTGGVYKKSNVINLGGFSERAFPVSDWDFHIRYINKFNLYVYFEELIVTRMGINDSLKIENRIGFIEKGYLIRKSMKRQLRTLFGNWWIQISCWRHAIGFHSLKPDDISSLELNEFYNTCIFKYFYFLVVFIYSRHLKFYVPMLETREKSSLESKVE